MGLLGGEGEAAAEGVGVGGGEAKSCVMFTRSVIALALVTAPSRALQRRAKGRSSEKREIVKFEARQQPPQLPLTARGQTVMLLG